MFHVPESFRRHDGPLGTDASAGNNGAFEAAPYIPGRFLLIIASDGWLWEHVSVHVEDAKGRLHTPVWPEMCYVKGLFWEPEDAVMQLHPPQSTWINTHPYTLHLWRSTTQAIPLPPAILVGLPGVEWRPVTRR